MFNIKQILTIIAQLRDFYEISIKTLAIPSQSVRGLIQPKREFFHGALIFKATLILRTILKNSEYF